MRSLNNDPVWLIAFVATLLATFAVLSGLAVFASLRMERSVGMPAL
jgi:hypothetical protein